MSNSKFFYKRDLFSPTLSKTIKEISDIYPSFFKPLEVNFPNTYLYGLDDFDILNHESGWIARDGLLLLNEFFLKHPKPLNLKSKIYIHETLVGVVPSSWHEYVGSYSFSYESKDSKEELSVMFYYGMPTLKRLNNHISRVNLYSESVNFQHDLFNGTHQLANLINSLQTSETQLEAAAWDFRSQNFLAPHYFWENIDTFFTAFSWNKYKMIQMNMVELGVNSKNNFEKRIRLSDSCTLNLQELIPWNQVKDISDYRKFISSLYQDKQHPQLKISINEMRTMWGFWKDMNEGHN